MREIKALKVDEKQDVKRVIKILDIKNLMHLVSSDKKSDIRQDQKWPSELSLLNIITKTMAFKQDKHNNHRHGQVITKCDKL